MDPLQALILGIVQGLTEFLPISSTAHLVFIPWLFGWQNPAINSLQFDVALHMGTLLAVLAYFARDWVALIAAGVKSIVQRKVGSEPDRRMFWYLVVGSIPAAIVGGLFEDKIDQLFHDQANLRIGVLVIGIMLVVMGAVLLLAERLGRHATDMRHISFSTAVGIGLAQALALIPGVSRSGSTITAGLFLGLTREAAARFSFLLATPVVFGAGLKKLYDVLKAGGIQQADQMGFAIGFVAAAVSGFLCIFFLLRYLQRHSTAPFIWYRFMVGAGLVILVLIGLHA